MWNTSCTSVTPSAHQTGQHQSGPGPDVGGPDRRAGQPLPAADRRVVPVGAGVCAHPDQLVDEPESGLEHVLGDQRMAVGDRGQRQRHRLQVGGERRVRQGDEVDRPRAPVHRHREPAGQFHRPRPRRGSAAPAGPSRCAGSTPSTPTPTPGDRRRVRPGAADDPVADGPVHGRVQRVDALDGDRRATRPGDVRAHLAEHQRPGRLISGSRAALSITVVPSASTAAIRMFSVAPTLGKSRRDRRAAQVVRLADHRRRARSPSGRRARAGRSGACPAGGIRWRPRRAARPWPGGSRPISGPSTQTEARSRPTAGKSAYGDSSAGVVMVTVSPDRSPRSPAPQHVGHQRDVEDLGTVRDRGRALGEQRRRHQLQHAVLGAGDPDTTRQAGPRRSPGSAPRQAA